MAPSFSKLNVVNFVNLVDISYSAKRAGAINIIFEYKGKVYKMGFEFDYGDLHFGVAIKLIRQYFAKRTDESATVFFENIPVSSPEDLQNINITFEMTPHAIDVNFPKFEYTIRNTDTNMVYANYKYDHFPEPCNYVIELNNCNICDVEDYIFGKEDFEAPEYFLVY